MWIRAFYGSQNQFNPTQPMEYPSKFSPFIANIRKYHYSGQRSVWNVSLIKLITGNTIETTIIPKNMLDVLNKVKIKTENYGQHNFDVVLRVIHESINKGIIQIEWKYDSSGELLPFDIKGSLRLFDNTLRLECGFMSIDDENELIMRKEEYRHIQNIILES
jgi:hypothetical protein